MLHKITELFSKKSYSRERPIYQIPFYDDSISYDHQNVFSLYKNNVIAFSAVNLIASNASDVNTELYRINDLGNKTLVKQHPLIDLLKRPNPQESGKFFFQKLYTYKLIHGNSYIQKIENINKAPIELYNLRPDQVKVIAEKTIPTKYIYSTNKRNYTFNVNPITGDSTILQLKNFHPESDCYGYSPIRAAQNAIERHNYSDKWNRELLKNGARPSGALIVKDNILTEEQFSRLQSQINNEYCSSINSGKPLILEGGIEWKEMSMKPKDMDFIESRNNASREIALALGVPSQLLGIPGDNQYANFNEARLSFWEHTIIPLVKQTINELNNWLSPRFDSNLELHCLLDNISALEIKKSNLYKEIKQANFLTANEKRKYFGLQSVDGGDKLEI